MTLQDLVLKELKANAFNFAVETLSAKIEQKSWQSLQELLSSLVDGEGLGSERKVLLELLQKEIGMFAAPERKKAGDAKTRRDSPMEARLTYHKDWLI